MLTITQFGAAVGGGLAGAVWTTVLPQQLRLNLSPEYHGRIEDIMGSLVVAASFPPDSSERNAINKAYTHTQWLLNLLALIALIPAFLAMLGMENATLVEQEKSDMGHFVILGKALAVDTSETIFSLLRS